MRAPSIRGRTLASVAATAAASLAFAAALLAQAPGEARYRLASAQVEKGDKMIEKGEHEKAEKLYRKAIDVDPSLPTAHLGLGAALVAQHRFDEALEALVEAEKRFVEWDALTARADLEQRQIAFRDTQELEGLAGARTQGVTPPGPGEGAPKRFDDLAGQRATTQQFLAAERWKLEEVQAIAPQVFYLEGIAYLRTQRMEQGMQALELCLALEPRHGLAHYNLAVALFGMGEAREAKPHLDAAVAAGVEPHPAFVADLERALAGG